MLKRIGSGIVSVLCFSLVPLFLLILSVGFFWQQVFFDRILGGYDITTYFYPYRDYASFVLREGKIPLWNPYIFLGVPFLANIQSAVFYPFNLLSIYLTAPEAVTVSIITHIFLAGLFMYAFCRVSIGLDSLSALIGGIVFMFSGFLMQQTGHVNQLNASAWIPLVFLLFDQASKRRSFVFAILGAVVIALQLLAGHSQESYLTMFALGFFYVALMFRVTLRAYREGKQELTGITAFIKSVIFIFARMAGEYILSSILFAVMVGLGVGLAAFQLLPTLELSQQSIREGGMAYREAVSFSLPPWQMLRSLLPGFLENPFSEFVAYVGFVPLALALLAIAVRRKAWFVLFFFLLAVLALFMALGGFNPFYQILYNLLPGLNLFRVPARWLYLYTFALATLAAVGMNCFVNPLGRKDSAEQSVRSFKRAQFWIVSTLLVVFGAIWLLNPLLAFPKTEILAIWIPMMGLSILLITVGVFWAPDKKLNFLVLVMIIAELYFARIDLESFHPIPSESYTSMRPTVAQLLTDTDLFRILSISVVTFDPGDMADTKLRLKEELPPERVTELIVNTKYKEVVTPNLPMTYKIASVDGYDGGVLPLKKYVDFKRLLLESGGVAPSVAKLGDPNQPDGLLREQLAGIPDSKLLGLMNVKYVVIDKAHDKWIDGVYYDLSTSEKARPTQSLTIDKVPSFATTSIGFISYLRGAESISNTVPVAKLVITDSEGRTTTTVLKAGTHTAEGTQNDPAHPVAHSMAPISSLWRGSPNEYDYYAKIDLGSVVFPKKIEVVYTGSKGDIVVRGISLIDDRTKASQSVTVDPRFKLVQSGDTKIYQNLDWLPRAYVVSKVEVVEDTEKTLDIMRNGFWDKVVLNGSPTGVTISAAANTPVLKDPQGVQFLSYSPEEIVMAVDSSTQGYLVLTETFYPGWHASVDGKETEILRANLLFKAVPIGQGSHQVRFWYEPDSLYFGWTVTKACIGVAIVILALVGLGKVIMRIVRLRRLSR